MASSVYQVAPLDHQHRGEGEFHRGGGAFNGWPRSGRRAAAARPPRSLVHRRRRHCRRHRCHLLPLPPPPPPLLSPPPLSPLSPPPPLSPLSPPPPHRQRGRRGGEGKESGPSPAVPRAQ